MKQILLPEPVRHRLVFYLAMEEYVAARYGEGFFIWQSRPTVIFGRNQDMEAEVNIEYCRSHGIEMYRRKSGGGCVYSDEGNIMLSCITRTTDVTLAFRDYLRSHEEAVREYSRIKEEGAKLFPNDIDGYISYKTGWIEKIYREIGL